MSARQKKQVPQVRPEAIIEIASTGIRLSVVEILPSGHWNTLDRSDMPVNLGMDIFTGGSVKQSTIAQCIQILSRYKEQLKSWGIEASDTSVIATAALRESRDKDSIIDRIFIRTGFVVRVIDGVEENRLMYLAVRECFKDSKFSLESDDYMILEAGGGSSEMMLLKKGSIVSAHSFRLGTIRVEGQIGQSGESDTARRFIQQFILNSKNLLNEEFSSLKLKSVIAVGKQAQIAALNVGHPVSTFLWEMPRQKFIEFVDEIQEYSIEECLARFKIAYSDAAQLRIGLLIYKMFVEITNVANVIVPETNLREGALINKLAAPNEDLQRDFYKQITAGALNLLRKYHGDEGHAQFVTDVSLKIFDALKSEIALDERARVLLEVAAMLHDIGIFIRMENHHEHSAYIISNSEFFGLTQNEITIVSQIAKYHRGHSNPQDDDHFQMLPRASRMTILKLTAIIRIADAIDRSHTQKFTQLKITKQKDSLVVHTGNKHNTVLERQALGEKGGMFESVFGYKVILS